MTGARVVLAFDVYGTLIDTAGVVAELHDVVGDQAESFSRIWREKQLEYSFRRALMQRYVDFSVCVEQSLDYTASILDAKLTADQRQSLLRSFTVLPAFDDARTCLGEFGDEEFALFALSNDPMAFAPIAETEALVRQRDVLRTMADWRSDSALGRLLADADAIAASLLAPVAYFQLLSSATIGWIVFGEVPGVAMISGAAIIVASGLYVARDA